MQVKYGIYPLSRIFRWFHCYCLDPVLTANVPLMSSGWPVTLILGSYLLFVLKIGKWFMEHRKPYNLKNVIVAYNLFQIIFNGALSYVGFVHVIFALYDLDCMETLPLEHPSKNFERALTYLYFINKIVDLLDTIFFVLRKSNKQITFLHVYHHVLMVSVVYMVMRFYGTGSQFTILGTLNTFVHTVMYFYYFISAKYPNMKSSLWWKKYITILQIVQFAICFAQSVFMLLFNRTCKFPIILQFVQLTQTSVMMFMFTKFYFKAYVKPKHQKSM
ncbi:hypothetical protein KR044_000899 [Drosophila immigrans]|nr:hypothetical protein KR044_000899 [Drosophila immigrans]